jgi:hypothetical protein
MYSCFNNLKSNYLATIESPLAHWFRRTRKLGSP